MIRLREGILGGVEGIRLDGLTRIGEGREAEVFALGDGRVLRLARTAALARTVDDEHAALAAAHRAGVPVPAAFERVDVDGRPGLVVERLGTGNLLLEIGARPWRVFPISRELGDLHARIHEVPAPVALPSVHQRVRARLESPLVPDDVRGRALEILDTLPEGDRLCHGDFNPANVLRASDGTPRLIDWTAASRGDPAADFARAKLVMRHGAVGPDATAAVRALARVGRRVLWQGYRRAYSRRRPVDRAAVDRWFAVMAATRLAEDIAEERATILKLATR
jgi:aminoglycoside phosphotransferase (APT) family kinase protein